MFLIQFLLIAFFLFAIYKVVRRFQAGDVPRQMLIFWLCFWVVAAVIVLFPVPLTSYFAELLGVGRGADLVVYVALALLFFMVFRLMVKAEKQSKEITVLTRKIALLEAEDKTKGS
ncbi:MAG TPA: DUF2304 family protein [Patescibacteria group bacterium]|nr:DUF2304 family protein [Patescibacteria group bacterium]